LSVIVTITPLMAACLPVSLRWARSA